MTTLRRLADNPNVSAVARELGFTRITCYSWAYKAGIRTSEARKVNPRRAEFLRLRAEGLTRAQARARVGADARSATDWDKGITIINFGMGSANAATVMDLLSAIKPSAVLFLGKCGGLKEKSQLGDLILPIAAIRGDGASNDYFPP